MQPLGNDMKSIDNAWTDSSSQFSHTVRHRYRPPGPRSKYHPLYAHLRATREDHFEMSFTKIENILDAELPPSARKWQAWWANDENGSHHHAQAWLAAGFKTSDVKLNNGSLIFERLGPDT